MTWKTSFKICGVIIIGAVFAYAGIYGIGRLQSSRARADVKAIALTRDDIITVANIRSQAQALKADYDAKMGDLVRQMNEVKKHANVPDSFVEDFQGNTVVGFKPKPPDPK